MYLNVVWSIVLLKTPVNRTVGFCVAQDDFFSTHERRSHKMKFKSRPLHLHFSLRFFYVASCSLVEGFKPNNLSYLVFLLLLLLCAFQDMQNMHDTMKNSCFRCKYSKTLIIYDIFMPKKKKKCEKEAKKITIRLQKKCM